MFRLIRLLPIA